MQRLRELQRSHDAQELAECSFQPQVLLHRNGIAGSKACQHEGSSKHRRLSASASEALAARLSASLPSEPRRVVNALQQQRQRNEVMSRDCTFAPDVSMSASSFESFHRCLGKVAALHGSARGLAASGSEPSWHEASKSSPSPRPQTNPIPPQMKVAKAYVSQDVFTRLSQPHPEQEVQSKEAVAPDEFGAISLSSISGHSTEERTGDASFAQFLERQDVCEQERRRRISELELAQAPVLHPMLSARSRRLAERRQVQGARCRSFSADAACTSGSRVLKLPFKPEITASAARRPLRGVDDLSFGDSARRDQHLVELRQHVRRDEDRQLPFWPQLIAMPADRGQLRVLEEPNDYMERLKEAQLAAEMWRKEEAQKNVQHELSECTFHPQVCGKVPIVVRRMAERFRIKQELQHKELEACTSKKGFVARPDWR